MCVESLVTALVDMYPHVFRKKNRREVLILGVSVTSFLLGLIMLTEVRLQGGDRVQRRSKGGQLPPVRWSRLPWFLGTGTHSFPNHRKPKVGGSFLLPLGIDHLLLGTGEGYFGSAVT